MALFVQQNSNRTKLQERLAKELSEKAKKKHELEADTTLPDGVEDSRYIEGTKKTTSLALVWILIVIAAVAITVWLVVVQAGRQ